MIAKPMCPFSPNWRRLDTVLHLKCPFAKTMVLDVNTQACADAIVRFNRTPIMQETPKSEKQNEGTNTRISKVNMFDFQDKARFEAAARCYKFNGGDE